MIRVKMLYYSIKRQVLYRTPNAVLLFFKQGDGILWFYRSLVNSRVEKRSGGNYLLAMVGLLVSLVTVPIVIIYYFVAILVLKRVYIPRIEVAITTYCSLKCRDCSNLMQYYNSPYHVNADQIIDHISLFQRGVYELEQLVLLGGEPFMHPELGKIVEYALTCKKIKSITIISNGIAKMNDTNLAILSNPRVTVRFSDYGIQNDTLDKNTEKVLNAGVRLLREREIRWVNMGDMIKRRRTDRDLQKQFRNCRFKCRCILNGKLFICPRASHGSDLGFFEDRNHLDLCDCRHVSERELGHRILNVYYSSNPSVACDYCDAGTRSAEKVPCGIQI